MQCPCCKRALPTESGSCVCGARQPDFSLFGTSFRGGEIVDSPISKEARRQLIRGPALAVLAFLVTLIVCSLSGHDWLDSAVPALLALYVAWSAYRGLLGIRRYATDRGDGFVVRLAAEFASNLSVYGFVLVPLLVGTLYGEFGGWYPEFVSTRRLARDPNSVLSQRPN